MQIKYFFFFALVFSAATAHAQKNAIKVQPLHFIWGKQSVQYERAYNAHNSITIELQRWDINKKNSSGVVGFALGSTYQTETSVNGFSIEGMNRHYLNAGMKGFYLEAGPHLSKYDVAARTETTTRTNSDNGFLLNALLQETTVSHLEDKNNTAFGAKGGVGYQLIKDGFVFDCGAGIRVQSVDKNRVESDPIKPYSVYIRAGIGYAF